MRFLMLLLVVLFAGCAVVTVPLQAPAPTLAEKVVGGSGRAKVALIDISGTITYDHLGLDRFSKEPPLVERFREMLERAADDAQVVAVVVRINSTGGSVTASDILFHEITAFKDRKKVPVIACIIDTALSGGYYAALAADEIFAHPTAVVGGVGVIAWRIDLSGLLDRWGIGTATVQSGELKDFWSPLRGSRPAEVAIMQEIVDGLHRRFLGQVQSRRPIRPDQLDRIGTGRLFAAEEALSIGLIDRLGYLEEATARARELAGVEEAKIILYRSPTSFAENIYAGVPLLREAGMLEQVVNELLAPSFRYQTPNLNLEP